MVVDSDESAYTETLNHRKMIQKRNKLTTY